MPRQRYVITVVGAGPRGTSVLERLLARLEDSFDASDTAPTNIDVRVVDPYHPGSGHVWNPRQSRLFLMNTPAVYPTVAPPRRNNEPGLTFNQWRESGGDGAVLASVERDELAALGPGDYPSRALYGRYLEHVCGEVMSRLAAHSAVASVQHVPATAVRLDRRDTDYLLTLLDADCQTSTLASDAVVLAVGHVPAELNPRQAAAGQRAEELGLTYQGPNVPTDVDWGQFAGGEPLLVRGMGLNFFDALAQLTVGRGGEFVRASSEPGHQLAYRPSGREPQIRAGSRRGVPYRAKADIPAFVPPSVELVSLTFERVHALAAAGAPGEPAGKVGFDAHIWPLLHRDVLRTYYTVAARVSPEKFVDAPGFLSRMEDILEAPRHPDQSVQGTRVHGQEVWRTQLAELVEELVPELGWLDVPGLGHPFAQRGFEDSAAYQRAVIDYLVEDARSSAAGESDPLKMAIGALHAGRLLIKRMVAEGLVDEVSRTEELQRWFEPLVEGTASGPPLRRIEELIALARAGVVQFLGPDPVYSLDEEGAHAGTFTASSPWVDAPPETAHHMLEAMMPANRVAHTASELLKQLQEDGLARPKAMPTEEGETIPGSGFDVLGRPYRLVDARGVAHRALFVIGLQLSSVQWGTAIAAEAEGTDDDGARTLADADAVAAELVRLAG